MSEQIKKFEDLIAQGSCAELRTQLYIAKQTGVLPEPMAEELLETTKRISAMLSKLIKTRKERF